MSIFIINLMWYFKLINTFYNIIFLIYFEMNFEPVSSVSLKQFQYFHKNQVQFFFFSYLFISILIFYGKNNDLLKPKSVIKLTFIILLKPKRLKSTVFVEVILAISCSKNICNFPIATVNIEPLVLPVEKFDCAYASFAIWLLGNF